MRNKIKNFFDDFLEPNGKELSVKGLGMILLAIGAISSIALYLPILQVFEGTWKLQQQIDLFSIPKISLGSPDWLIPTGDESAPFQLYFEILIGQISLRYYSLLILLGLLSGYAMALFLAAKQHLASTVIDRLLIGLLIFGIIGARLFFVAFRWDEFQGNPLNILLGLSQGGLAIFGAIIGGFLYLLFYTSRFRFNIWEFLDILAPGVLIGQVIGRWGNFFNYEAYGQPTSVYWKMFVPDSANISANINDRFFHPTFLYEIIPNFFLLIFILLSYSSLTRRHAGLVFATWAIGYGLVRTITEFFRLDALQINLNSTFKIGILEFNMIFASQIMAILLCLIGLVTYFMRSQVVYNKREMEELRFG